MSKKILFPFYFDKDFHRGYSWTMELAVKMNATLIFFTTVPPGNKADQSLLQNIYHSLLEARGNYLQYSHQAEDGASIAKTERCIESGDFVGTLSNLMRKTKFDLVVVDPQASLLSADSLKEVVENSNGVIVLPDQKTNLPLTGAGLDLDEKKRTEDFYDILRHSETYKLPGNFFRTLGNDKRLFNYLRGFFKKNPLPSRH